MVIYRDVCRVYGLGFRVSGFGSMAAKGQASKY